MSRSVRLQTLSALFKCDAGAIAEPKSKHHAYIGA
jgi:hypothetical protein